MGLFVAVDFFEKIDNFMSVNLELSKAIIFFLFKFPLIISQILPICLLLAVLVSLGLMNKHNEITALKSSGVSIAYILRPILFIGIFCSVTLFMLSEIIVPLTVPKSNRIWIEDVKKKHMIATQEKNIWIMGKQLITHIKYYNPIKKTAFGMSFYYIDDHFRLVKRIDVKKGVYDQGKWHLYDVMEQILNENDGACRVNLYEDRVESLDLLPEDLKRVAKKSEEMNFGELYAYINKLESEGYDAMIYKVDLYAKAAFPFVCVIMCLLGTGIGVKGNIKEGLPVGIAYGIGIAFLYWVFYSFCLSLGYGGLLPPFIAAWAANFLFSCWGLYVLLNAD